MLVAAEGWARTMTPASNYAARGPADPLGPEVEAIAGEMALAEARALLSRFEPIRWDAWMDEDLRGLHPTHRAILAEALESFVLCPALPRGYGINVNDCACGGCTRGTVA